MPYRLSTPDLETQAHHIRSVRPSRLLVDSLWAIAIRQTNDNPERPIELITKARDVATSIGYNTGLILCDIANAMLTLDRREIESAAQQIEVLAGYTLDDEHTRGWITLLQALLHRKRHEEYDHYDEYPVLSLYEPQETISLALRAYSDLVRVSDIVGIGYILSVLGISFAELGMTRTALAYQLEYYQIWEQLEDPLLLLTPLAQIADTYSTLSDYEKAVFYLAEGVRISHADLGENTPPDISTPAWWFQTHYDMMTAPYDGPAHFITYRAQADVILLLQRLLVKTQREDEANRAEDALFALEPMSEEMEAHVARMKVLREQDATTGLYHRGYLEKVLPDIVKESENEVTPLSVLLLDIDDFQAINDKFNSLYADRVLYHMGAVLTDICTPPALPTRYGGDQFLLVLPGYDSDAAHSYAKTLQIAITQTSRMIEGATIEPFTISIGVTSAQASDTAELLLQKANAALAQAKQMGGNRIEIA